jgi:hypothetical protein
MHAIAQSSPVTDLQHRLVLAKEARDLASGALSKPLVGDLCVKCHAPTGSLGDPADHEDPLIQITDRAPASQFGVSCVTCHQIDKVERGLDGELPYKNVENLTWTHGKKLMLGPIGGPKDDIASIGNSHHRGEFRDHFGTSEFCASCHTVAVDPPSGQRLKLQDTYNEFLQGGPNANWHDEKFVCLDCHGRDLTAVVAKANSMQRERRDLTERRREIAMVLLDARPEEPLEIAAEPANGFDRELPGRRRFLHTFVGVWNLVCLIRRRIRGRSTTTASRNRRFDARKISSPSPPR